MRYENCFYGILDTPLPDMTYYEIGSDALNITFPTYTMMPPSCTNEISYTYELVSKVSDLVFGMTSPFLDPMYTVPTFWSADPLTKITISGNDFAEAWNTYEIRVKMYEARASISNLEYIVPITTYVNCTNARSLPLSAPLPAVVSYEIMMPAVQVKIPEVDDPMSKEEPLVCGPISYRLYSTDAAGVILTQIPDFVNYVEANLAFDIYSVNTGKAGTYYLALDTFYTYLEMDKNAYHSR